MKNKVRIKSLSKTLGHWRIVALGLMVCDFGTIHLSYFLALWYRFGCVYSEIPAEYLNAYGSFITPYAVGSIVVFLLFRMYRSVWRYVSYDELLRTFLGSVSASVGYSIITTLVFGRMPVSYYLWGGVVQLLFLLVPRFAFRFLLFIRANLKTNDTTAGRVMIIGAGQAGQMLLRDMRSTKEPNNNAICFIDDNPNKWGRYISGVPIVGGREDILKNVEKYRITKIFLAIPSAAAEQRRDILNICKETTCELKNLPGMYQLVNGTVSVTAMHKVEIEDLLGREPVRVDMDEIYEFIRGKTILVTGGGGSIGSELCRQIAAHAPKLLVIFDIYENNAHAIQLELQEQYPSLELRVLIGSVRDSRRINQVFQRYKPEVVYHAAAHKHVPLMEYSPCESIKNNAIGTYKTAYAAMQNGCKRFVLISTDKAVNPTNIMGASKRLCEMIIQSFDRKLREGRSDELLPLHVHGWDEDGSMRDIAKTGGSPGTEFVAVRFGNVLGSNGSVVPLFKQQIAKGGPVTVTHPDITRYFMTIPEATSLVLQAGTYAKGGEIFVLDMGSPVKIDTLARNLIKLSGLRPDEDIKIEYTGLRPGEKLYEEKLMSEEGLRTTPNHLIHIGSPIQFDTDTFLGQLQMLMETAYAGKEEEIRALVEEVVPTYHPAGASTAKGELAG